MKITGTDIAIGQISDAGVFRDVLDYIYPQISLPKKRSETVPAQHLDSLWVATVGGVPAGRFSIYRNENLRYNGHPAFCIGHYECVDDEATAATLLQHASQYIRDKGGEYIIGPMNGSTWENYRFATTSGQGFFLEALQHTYYVAQWRQSGFGVIAEYGSHMDCDLPCDEEKLRQSVRELAAVGIRIRKVDLPDFAAELRRMFALCAESFQYNFLFTPISEHDFIAKNLPVEPYLEPDLLWLACDANENIVGFIFALPDHENASTKTAIVKTLCRLPGAAYYWVVPALCNQLTQSARQRGYQRLIHAFMHKQNASMCVSARFSGLAFKEYVLLGKRL